MDVNDSFYDELSSFMPSPNQYFINHHDFDDIISSTVSQLDSSLDPNTFLPQSRETSLHNNSLFSDLFQTTADSYNNLELNFDNLSAASTLSSTADRTSLISSTGDSKSVSNIINVCNDSTEIEKLTCGNLLGHIQDRDTPSPTESCGSFSGSSTSGIHSDNSDIWHNMQMDQNDLMSTMHSDSQLPISYVQSFTNKNEDSIQKPLQKHEFKASIPNNQKLQGKTVINSAVVFQTALAVNKEAATVCMPGNGNTSLTSQTQKPVQEKIQIEPTTDCVGKTKTIFLSSNDYKALMEKINLNGAKGAKINGSIKAQIPKIVMKEKNYKVHVHQNLLETCRTDMPSPSNLFKNQHQTHFTNRDISMDSESFKYMGKNSIDEKMYKKQQRMIKNRQSASLSRKKKKEYVVSLETRINNLEKENYKLKEENMTLRNQLVAFAKTCKCRKGSVCEFVLHSLSSTGRPDQHIKIAPKPSSKSFKQHMNAATVKKNVAVLFAMAFMVTLNAGNFQSYLTKQNYDAEKNAVDADIHLSEPIPISRRLLWVESEEEYNEKLNQSNRQSEELAMPPLRFLRPISRTSNVTKNVHWNSTNSLEFNRGNDPPPLKYPSSKKCNGLCASSNSSDKQSEYSRLAFNLEKLINISGNLNLNMNTKLNTDGEDPDGFKFSTEYLDLPDMKRQTSNLGKRKHFMDYNERLPNIEQNQQKVDIQSHYNKNSFNTSEAIPLFRGIKRQDDTFYVLSFNTDHILLSPSTYNKSSRPKMSLLLPSAEPSQNGDIMMMQIDCEVFNTKELELKSHMIPARLQPNITKWQIREKHSLNANNKTVGNIKMQNRSTKEDKPRVRTYFMVGPKNQAAAAVSQEKPRLVEFNNSMVNNSKLLAADFDSQLHG